MSLTGVKGRGERRMGIGEVVPHTRAGTSLPIDM